MGKFSATLIADSELSSERFLERNTPNRSALTDHHLLKEAPRKRRFAPRLPTGADKKAAYAAGAQGYFAKPF